MKVPELFFEKHPSPMFIFDVDTLEVLEVNKSAEEKYGYTRDEFRKLTIEDIRPPEDVPELRKKLEEVRGKGKTKIFTLDKLRHQAKDGEILYVQITSQCFTSESKDTGILYIRDVTEKIQLKNEVNQLYHDQEHLQNSLEEKKLLLSEIHHRIKNNLAVICSLLELEGRNWEEDSAVRKVLKQSKLRIYSMASIHEKLYESQNFDTLSLENYISDLLNSIYDTMQGEQKDIDINFDCNEVSLNINQAIPSALIVNELVTNAFKYAFNSSDKGKLEVKFKNNDGRISLVVTDNGPGLPDNFDKIKNKSLGHRLVNQLVKQLEGEIKVESNKNEGTRYKIAFDKKSKTGSASGLC